MKHVAEALVEAAYEIADGQAARISSVRKEIGDLEARLAMKRALLAELETSQERVSTYRPVVDGDAQCPRCWIKNGRAKRMTPLPSDGEDDRFRCPDCGQEVSAVQ
jgi:Zn finger protein HypA/HybF involved in hydrogenase expression